MGTAMSVYGRKIFLYNKRETFYLKKKFTIILMDLVGVRNKKDELTYSVVLVVYEDRSSMVLKESCLFDIELSINLTLALT